MMFEMFDKVERSKIEDPNEWTSWIEEAISKKHIKHYDYKHFHNIQQIGIGAFGKIYRANWKHSDDYFALKSLIRTNNVAIKEIVHEVNII